MVCGRDRQNESARFVKRPSGSLLRFIQKTHASAASAMLMWCDKAARQAGADARNAVFYGDKAIDRSPCGTGSSARMAQLAAKGRLAIGAGFVHESIIGTLFKLPDRKLWRRSATMLRSYRA